ncbi:MAG: hypothetical protein JWR55_2447 [Aeromicrobium sp.]|nr:hypothetical protein [Aeromicrobium sp.]
MTEPVVMTWRSASGATSRSWLAPGADSSCATVGGASAAEPPLSELELDTMLRLSSELTA